MQKKLLISAGALAVCGLITVWALNYFVNNPQIIALTGWQATQVGMQVSTVPVSAEKKKSTSSTSVPFSVGRDLAFQEKWDSSPTIPDSAFYGSEESEPREVIKIEEVNPTVAQAIARSLDVESALIRPAISPEDSKDVEVIVNRLNWEPAPGMEPLPPDIHNAKLPQSPASQESLPNETSWAWPTTWKKPQLSLMTIWSNIR